MAVTDDQLNRILSDTQELVSEFPRVNLPQDWGVALVEDYDAKGRNINLLLDAVNTLTQAVIDLRNNP